MFSTLEKNEAVTFETMNSTKDRSLVVTSLVRKEWIQQGVPDFRWNHSEAGESGNKAIMVENGELACHTLQIPPHLTIWHQIEGGRRLFKAGDFA